MKIHFLWRFPLLWSALYLFGGRESMLLQEFEAYMIIYKGDGDGKLMRLNKT